MRLNRSIWALMLIAVLTATVSTGLAPKPAPKTDEWTLMIYMAADNDLDAWAYENMAMMETVELSDRVNVIVLWDGYDLTARLYEVAYGGSIELDDFPLHDVEVNMGDSATLAALVDYGMQNFPAEKYLLELWDHGDDFVGSCWDEHPHDYLTHPEVVAALDGHHIDILAYDTCLEAMIEVAYEYNAGGMEADYLVACENYIPLYGYPYDTILENLTADPDVSPLDFATTIAAEYVKYYEPRAHFDGGVMATLSVIDISMVDEATVALAELTATLEANMEEYHDLVGEAKGEGNLPWAEYGWEYYIDMPSFVKYLQDNGPEEVSVLAGNLLTILQEDVVKAVFNSEPMESAGAMGIGIWFPPSSAPYWTIVGLVTYKTLLFADEGWLDFLYAYWPSPRGGAGRGLKR